jgi:hypothetical protein
MLLKELSLKELGDYKWDNIKEYLVAGKYFFLKGK